MEDLVVLPSALKHGISKGSVVDAWRNFVARRPRGDDCLAVVGFDWAGTPIESVGLVLVSGEVLVIHAMSPVTEKIRRELGIRRQ